METVMAPRWYNAVWRWHFYAGLLCMPFILWLSVTGTLYLWKPQIEAWQERGYDRLATSGARASPETIAAIAVAHVPGGVLARYQLPDRADQAVRVLVARGGVQTRVYVDPYTRHVLGAVREDARLMRTISLLHGTLLAGRVGSWIVEIAACWTITMLMTGLYLWWPRGARGLGGILYPRWHSGRRLFWRDTHAVAGIWVSLAAVFLIATGLPWANAWGSYLGEVRSVTGTSDGAVDWIVAGKRDAHAEHRPMPGGVTRPGELERVVAIAQPLGIAGPVMIAPPKRGTSGWTVASDAADRPRRTTLTIDGATGAITHRRDFAQRHWIDRAVGYGVAIHEGAFFGIANQILGTIVTLLLATLSVSGCVLWWRRRQPGTLGAPVRLSRPRYGWGLVAGIAALGVAMPLFGVTLLGVLGLDRLAALRRA